jgi:DNA helicase II / ATP-dependent DNA helicase PcrA
MIVLMEKEVFEKLYKGLNKAQKMAVDNVEGPVMVIAGPGTGKTLILTLRIANILKKTDTSAQNILALTFTESGVYSMRKKLVGIIGSLAYKVNIHTFHSFCNEIIKSHPEDFPEIIGSNNISEVEQIKIIESILDKHSFKKIKFYGDNSFYVKPILGAIRDLKRDAINPQEFKKLIEREEVKFENTKDLYHTKGRFKGLMKGEYKDLEKKLSKNKELFIVYKEYEESLREKRFYDYEDMITKTLEVLSKNKNLLLELQEKYQYFLVDEHQDTNNAQNKLLELLNNFHKNPNLFIVGDEKQAIFRFQGASLENFLYFKNLYKNALLVNLDQNYRSTKPILESSHSVIVNNKNHNDFLRTKLQPNVSYDERRIKILDFSNPDYEHIFIVEDIDKKIKSGVNPGSIAVLYRDNADVLPLSKIFEKTKNPFVIESNQDVLADDDINKLLLIFRCVHNLGNENLLSKVLHIDFWGLENIDIFKILDFSRKEKKKLSSILKNKDILKKIGVKDPEKFKILYSNLEKWSKIGHNINFIDTFENVLNEAKFIKYLLKNPASVEKMNKLENLFNEIRKISLNDKDFKLSSFIDYLNILINYNILIKMREGVSLIESVHLMTAHKSKGLEFDYVYIIGANDGHWGNRKSVSHFYLPGVDKGFLKDSNEDERRLFYVALTRAKKEVFITYARENFDKEYKMPSQFLSEIDKNYIEEVNTQEIEKKIARGGTTKYSPKKAKPLSFKNQDYLRNLFLEQGFSVTAINNYIQDPWKYFFDSLVRIPSAPNTSQEFGNAIHEALSSKIIKKESLLKTFEEKLKRKSLNDGDYKKYLERGKRVLSGYYDKYEEDFKKEMLNELDIAGVFTEVTWKGEKINILLKGKIDKIELLDEGLCRVVDFKTGGVKSRNEIEGKTKNSKGEYKRQLVFYKLLLNKYERGRFNVKEGVIDFVEPDEKGKYKREIFEITEDEVRNLENEVKKIALEILNFDFWKTKPKKDSKYRELVEMIVKKQ